MKLGKYEITADAQNFVLQEVSRGKEKIKDESGKMVETGEMKDMLSSKKFYPTIETLINYILNYEPKKMISSGDIKTLQDILKAYEVCKNDLLKNIKMKYPEANVNHFKE